MEPFAGSSVQLDFAQGTQTITSVGRTPQALQPPADTYYALWGTDSVTAADGSTVDYVFEIQRFEIKPVIDQDSPCFIDLEGTRFPGLHVTQIANKVSEQTGVADPFNPPPGASDGDISDVLTARKRVSNLGDLQAAIKIVTSTSNFHYAGLATECIEDNAAVDQSLFPPPRCTGEQSNALRLKLCKAAWAANPDFYEGSDKTFTLPLNGTYYGTVEGRSPINAAPNGGSAFFADEALAGMERYFITWQYKDLNGDGTADFPDGTPDADKTYGHTYMAGTARRVARGVISVAMQNAVDPSIGAAMTIFPNLAEDGTHF